MSSLPSLFSASADWPSAKVSDKDMPLQVGRPARQERLQYAGVAEELRAQFLPCRLL